MNFVKNRFIIEIGMVDIGVRMKKRGKVLAIGIVVAYFILIIAAVAVSAINYSGKPYELDQSAEWVYRARATNDLNDMSKYLNESLKILEKYSGNPAWWFPKPDTNIDLIRSNIEECVRNCFEFNNLTDFAYQQAVHNLQETELEIAEHLTLASGYAEGNIAYTIWGIVVALLFLTLWIPFAYESGK